MRYFLMTGIKSVAIGILLLILLAHSASAQNTDIDSIGFTYVKEFEPTISDAQKLEDAPVFNDSTKKINDLQYGINSRRVNTSFNVDPIKPARMVGEPLTRLYRSLVKAGGGNYNTPYAEYFYNSLRSKESAYGLHLKHLSSQTTLKDAGYSAFSDNVIDIYGKKFYKKHSLESSIDFSRNVVHYYGYDVSLHQLQNSTTFQAFTHVEPKLLFRNYVKDGDSSKTGYQLGMRYYYHGDAYSATESNFKVDGLFNNYIGNGQLLTTAAYIDYYNNGNALDTTNNVIVNLNPSIAAAGSKWTANLGASVFLDARESATQFKFYFKSDFNYHVVDEIFIPYAGVTGGLHRNSFYSYYLENNFIASEIDLSKNTDEVAQIYLGIRGTFTKETYYNAKASFSRVKGMPFYVNLFDNVLENTFTVLYDTVNHFKVSGEVGFQRSEKLRMSLQANYNNYQLENLPAPYHKPAWEVTFSTNYNISDKLIFRSDIFYIGKRKARNYYYTSDYAQNFMPTELNHYADVNLGIEYRYNKRLGAFMNLNNIGATKFYRWNKYRSQRFNVLAGVSYAF